MGAEVQFHLHYNPCIASNSLSAVIEGRQIDRRHRTDAENLQNATETASVRSGQRSKSVSVDADAPVKQMKAYAEHESGAWQTDLSMKGSSEFGVHRVEIQDRPSGVLTVQGG